MGLEDIEKMSGELAMADGYRGQPLIVDLPVDRRRLLRPSTAYAFFGAQTAFQASSADALRCPSGVQNFGRTRRTRA
jgi:hypothetical protein